MSNQDRSDHALLAALSHPLRRQILRLMPDDDERAITPVELSNQLGERLTHVSYHVRVLVECGAAKLVRTVRTRGAKRHFYRRTVEAGWAKEVLAKPEQDVPSEGS